MTRDHTQCLAYEGPSIPTNPSPKKVVERETEETTDKEQSNFKGSTAQIPPSVIPISIPEPDVPKTLPKTIPIPKPDVPKSLPKQNIPYPSRLNQEKFCEKASYQKEKIFQMFQDLRFDISFADALFLLPRFAPTIRNLLMNKEKLLELAKIPLNENCSAMLLKKLPKSLEIPASFLFHLSLPELTPTRMTLELADRSITHPKGLAEDVYVKVGKLHFPTDFVVVDFEANPRVPLILGRSFLRTGRALIDVYGEEITLFGRGGLDHPRARLASINDKSVNRIDIIEAVCEEYASELLGFSNNDSSGGNPTLTSEPLTSEFILEEIETYLKDDSISPKIDHAYCDPEGDICLIEKLLNNAPAFELELKDLPSHLEYAYLEENDKLPVIIAKGLKDDEKEALLKVLKSHKWAIAWKITDIKGIDPRFCTHKILMEDDYKPTVQSQRRVNPKIYEVIKKEVLKLLDAGMIYPISDSPWVSPVHCVPKKGGITVVANEENELILTRLVTGWRVCIDYRKLNEATRKDHFPLPFMDQMLVVWGCEALVKRDTPEKLQQRSVKCIFVGYPKETMGYYFYFPPENKIVIARSVRTHRAPECLCLNVEVEEHSPGDLNEPTKYKGALSDTESAKWIDAMYEEMQSMKDNQIWRLVDLPPNAKTVRIKWIFKKKTNMDDNIHTYKARLVAKCYTKTYGIDYEETFYHVADIRVVRILITTPAYYDYEIWQMDVNTAFLHGYLNEDIYMVQPKGFIDPKHPRKIIMMGNHIPMLQDVKSYLGKCFAMKDSVEATFILGIKIYRGTSKRLIGLSQSAYMDKILKIFRMDNSKSGNIPIQERLDLNKTQGASTPEEVKRMQNVRYVSADMFLVYGGNLKADLKVTCYCDGGFKTYRDGIKSLIGYVFILDVGAVDWKSSEQSTTAMSATEPEYIAASEAAMEAIWIRKFISGLGIVPTNNKPIKKYCDNFAAILIANEPGVQKGTIHYHKRYHYVRENIELGKINPLKVHTYNNLDNPFTKALPKGKLTQHARSIGLRLANNFM
ncbi:reverse transcriptase domain-containing protein [Tanacetum coccineum]|uniref:Reverse transcriptase domain-containing protein n=1 Tax=Tanacetum coccineum TaxID=301880 RepID=A0ABQ4X7U9_9ASTR